MLHVSESFSRPRLFKSLLLSSSRNLGKPSTLKSLSVDSIAMQSERSTSLGAKFRKGLTKSRRKVRSHETEMHTQNYEGTVKQRGNS